MVTEIFSESDTGVNRGLTSGHRHVGCIGNERSTFHDTYFLQTSSCLVLDCHCELREITQHFSHLVTTFTATNVNDSIGVRKFGQRLTNDSFSTTEGARDSTCSTKHRGEKTVNDTKTGDKGSISWELLSNGTGTTNWPEVTEAELMSFVLGFIVNFHNNIINKEGFTAISSGGVNLADDTVDVGWAENLVRVNNFIFVDRTDNVSSGDRLPFLECSRFKGPAHVTRQTRNVYTLWYVNITRVLENVLQGTLDTIENGPHDTRSEFDGKRLLLSKHRVSNSKTGRIFVDLDRGGITFKFNDLSYKLAVPDTDKLVHSRPTHTIGHNKRSGDLEDEAIIGLFLFYAHF